MVYFVGVLTRVSRSGVVINAGEAVKCNVWVGVDENTRLPDVRLEAGRLAKIMAIPRWRKVDEEGERFALAFMALSIELK